MKNLSLLLLLFAFINVASAQQVAINKFFDKYADNTDFTQVNISPKMFELFAQMDSDTEMDSETLEMVKSLKGLKILTTDKNTRAIYKEFTSTVGMDSYEELMTIRDGDSDVKFLVKDSEGSNIVNELLLLVGGDNNFVLMSFNGKIRLDKIGELAKNMNISGSEHLENLDKK